MSILQFWSLTSSCATCGHLRRFDRQLAAWSLVAFEINGNCALQTIDYVHAEVMSGIFVPSILELQI